MLGRISCNSAKGKVYLSEMSVQHEIRSKSNGTLMSGLTLEMRKTMNGMVHCKLYKRLNISI